MENWKQIDITTNYLVSDKGDVKCIKNGKNTILKPEVTKSGYKRVSLSINGIRFRYKVHQLVAMAFLNHKPCGMDLVINHINFNKLDNSVDNLEIVTNRENTNLKHKPSSSQYVGVCWNKNAKKWKAQIVIHGKKVFLGYFKQEIDAKTAYEQALISLT